MVQVYTVNSNGQTTIKFDHITVDQGLPQNFVHSIAKDKYGFMWFGTWCGACRYDGYSFKVFRASEDDITSLPDNMINAIAVDSSQNIWIETADLAHVFKYDYEREVFTRFLKKKTPASILNLIKKAASRKTKTVQNKRFKFTAESLGLSQYSYSTNQVTFYQSNPNDPFSLSDNSIYSIYIDDTDNLWVGTQNGGVNHANLNIKPFTYYHADKIGNGLIENGVRAICKDKKGRLWIGSEDRGVTIIERSARANTYTYLVKNELIDTKIRSICCDKLGFVWIGSCGGLDRFDPHTNKIKHYRVNEKGGFCDPRVYSIMEDHIGTLWVGTLMGLAVYDRLNDSFTCLKSSKIIVGEQVRAILEDHNYNVWIATEDGGLTKIQRDLNGNLDLHHPIHYVHKTNVENSIISNHIYTLNEDNDGMIWIGTNFGLSRFCPKSNQFKHFTIKSGLPDDMIMGVLFDGKKHVWISHKKGLTRLDKNTFDIKNFNLFDGLQGRDFNQSTCFRDTANGEMYFGGTNGLNSFYPDSIKINKYNAAVVFTRLNVMNQIIEPGVKVHDRVILEKSLLCTDEITLTWWEKTFSLEFSALNFANPQGCKYKHKLEGIDKQWIFTDASTRIASYSHLPVGTYKLMVYAANNDGVWSDTPATLQIKVLPPLWLTWWAETIYIILFCTLLWFILRFISARIEFRDRLLVEKLKNEKNEELMDIKLQFFTEISHEFRTPLTLIIDPLEQLLSGHSDEEQVRYYYQLMNRNAKQLLDLINQLLDFRKLQSKNLSMLYVTDDIVAFVRNIASGFDSKADEQHIRFVVEAQMQQLDADFDTDKMRKILNNLLSNAFKFTPSYGEIIVRVKVEDADPNKVVLEVQDNGEGISAEHHDKVFDPFYQVSDVKSKGQGSGIGLALTKELVILHGGEIRLISDKGKGACFQIILPRFQEHAMTDQHEAVVELDHTAATAQPQVSEKQEDETKPLLLMVDDNADIRDYFSINFNKKYRVLTAVDGLAGFNKAIETIPDLIVSDIMMPGVDGIELCKRLKTDEHTSHIPVILLTAKQSDESRIEGYETGADAYVTKPFSTEVLGARIVNLLDQRFKLRQLYSNGSPTELKKIAVNITDEAFLNKVVALIEANMEDPDFNREKLATYLKMSHSQLYRKITALTNRNVYDFMTSIRMNKAKKYLLSGDFTIADTAYKVGYTLPTNFTRAFSKHFGENPTSYLQKHIK